MEEMGELFYRDAYIRAFDAEVLSCTKTKNGYGIILNDTAFYPEGGGQPGDHGRLNEIEVVDTKRTGDGVVHMTKQEILPGTKVHGVIDWERRFDLMQNHTGEHMVSGLIHRKYGYDNVGFHMGAVILLDFSGEITPEMMREIEREANRRIWQNLEVEITYPDEEELQQLEYRSKKELTGKVRIVNIPDTDICACCGTHLKRTGEVGLIHLLSVQKHGEGSRIEMLAGDRALRYLEGVADQNTEISHLLSAKPLETAKAVQRLSEQNGQLRHRAVQLANSYTAYRVDAMPESNETVIFREDGMDADSMRYLANAAVDQKKAGTAAVICRGEDDSFRYLIISRTRDLRPAGKKLNALLNGKGGGRPEMIQGTWCTDEKILTETLKEVLEENQVEQ
ncbi:MAG: hypothetical protein IJ130_03900 [Solobacterium sp.]|nr:hypothetical protein [Solobacterium sp.]